jgi:hypothetical protein
MKNFSYSETNIISFDKLKVYKKNKSNLYRAIPLSCVNSDDIIILTDKINNQNKKNNTDQDRQNMLNCLVF